MVVRIEGNSYILAATAQTTVVMEKGRKCDVNHFDSNHWWEDKTIRAFRYKYIRNIVSHTTFCLFSTDGSLGTSRVFWVFPLNTYFPIVERMSPWSPVFDKVAAMAAKGK
jgi:hypothetical protein